MKLIFKLKLKVKFQILPIQSEIQINVGSENQNDTNNTNDANGTNNTNDTKEETEIELQKSNTTSRRKKVPLNMQLTGLNSLGPRAELCWRYIRYVMCYL